MNDKTGTALESTMAYILEMSGQAKATGRDRLPTVRQISELTGTSRHTVWRALGSLCEDGEVESLPNGRYRFSARRLSNPLNKPIHFSVFAEGERYITMPLLERYYHQLAINAPAGGYTTQLYLNGAGEPLPCRGSASAAEVALILGDAEIPAGFTGIEPARIMGVQTHPGHEYANLLTCDYFKGGELAAEAMLQGNYKRPTLITWAINGVLWTSFELRILGFKKRLLDAGIRTEAIRVVQLDADNILRRMDQLVAIVQADPQSDFYFCFNDLVAEMVADILAHQGQKVPESIGLVGFDGAIEALNHRPRITTICQPMEELANRTPALARTLLEDSNKEAIGTEKAAPYLLRGETIRQGQA